MGDERAVELLKGSLDKLLVWGDDIEEVDVEDTVEAGRVKLCTDMVIDNELEFTVATPEELSVGSRVCVCFAVAIRAISTSNYAERRES